MAIRWRWGSGGEGRTQTTAHFAPWIRLVSPTFVLPENSSRDSHATKVHACALPICTYTVIIGSYFSGYFDGTGSYLLTLAKGPGAVVVSTGDEGGAMKIGRASCRERVQGEVDAWTLTAKDGD